MIQAATALDVLMRGLIDYAGLFPPAAHNMAETVRRYARYRLGRDASALGRFVVPAARLMEWEQSLAALPADARGRDAWRLTALVALPAAKELAAVAGFNQRESTGLDFQARVSSIEVKVTSPEDVRRVASQAPTGVEVFFECAPGDLKSLLEDIRAAGGGAKIRTGGLVPSAIPPPGAVAEFVADCVAAAIPFKATAGLHHPVRAEHALTYEPDSPRAVMHGFLNVFVAATLAHACGLDAGGVLPILEETSAGAFRFSDAGLAWRNFSATVEHIARARDLARSFGSCSFEEPIADLKALGAHL